jgi:hypothetical protein
MECPLVFTSVHGNNLTGLENPARGRSENVVHHGCQLWARKAMGEGYPRYFFASESMRETRFAAILSAGG